MNLYENQITKLKIIILKFLEKWYNNDRNLNFFLIKK